MNPSLDGLLWVRGAQTPEESHLYLDPDHPHHVTNMREMTPLRRRILRAYLVTVLETIDAVSTPTTSGR